MFFASDKAQRIAAFLMSLFFFLLSAFRVQGRALDEGRHYKYGMNILNGDSTRFDDSKMPVSAWNALPAKIAESLPDSFWKTIFSKFLAARLMTAVFPMIGGFVVFLWTQKLYDLVATLYKEPLGTVAHSYLIDNISSDDITRLCTTTDYCK